MARLSKRIGILFMTLADAFRMTTLGLRPALQSGQQIASTPDLQIGSSLLRARFSDNGTAGISGSSTILSGLHFESGHKRLQTRGTCLSCNRRKHHGSSQEMLIGLGRPGGFPKSESKSTQAATSRSTSRTGSLQSTAVSSHPHALHIPPSINELSSTAWSSQIKPSKAKKRQDTSRRESDSTRTSISVGTSQERRRTTGAMVGSSRSIAMRPPRSQSSPALQRAWSDPVDRAAGSAEPRGRVIGTRLPRIGSSPGVNDLRAPVYSSTTDMQQVSEIVDGYLVRPGSQLHSTGLRHGLAKRGICFGRACGRSKHQAQPAEGMPLASPSHREHRPLSPSLKRAKSTSQALSLPKYTFDMNTGRLVESFQSVPALKSTNPENGNVPTPRPLTGGRPRSVSFNIPDASPEIIS